MNKTIWKYALEIETTNVILMPKGSEILSVELQNNKPFVWALVNPDEQNNETKIIKMFGTGEDVSNGLTVNKRFLGTIQPIENGVAFAFHLFEIIG